MEEVQTALAVNTSHGGVANSPCTMWPCDGWPRSGLELPTLRHSRDWRSKPLFPAMARTAAAAFECARDRGNQSALHDSLFARQSELDALRPEDYSRIAGVADHLGFLACMKSDSTRAAIDADVALGRSWGVSGTPTLFVNGARLPPVPADSLLRLIRLAVQDEARPVR